MLNSLVGLLTGYGADDRVILIRLPTVRKDFTLLQSAQTFSG